MAGQDGSDGQADPPAHPEGALMGAKIPLAPRGCPMGALQPPGDDSREAEYSVVRPKIPQALEKTRWRRSSGPSASEAEEDTETSEKERNQKRRNRKKKKRGRGWAREGPPIPRQWDPEHLPGDDTEVEIEYVIEEPEIYDSNFVFFKRIFEAFKLACDVNKDKEKEPERTESARAPRKKGPEDGTKGSDGDRSDDEQEKKQEVPKLSKKKLRRMNRLTVAELKQLVARPDMVEMHDVTARDPQLLVHLKAMRNSVPVPRHWCFKRKYLKRGIEKPPFELPETMKSKIREKVRPKIGKIDIDYQKLHDAFFRWQTKPKLTIHGGKEFETRLKEKKPGELPEDETGKAALWGVSGTNAAELQTKEEEEIIDRTPWGELEPSDKESSEEDSDEEKPDETGFIILADSGLITPGAFSSVPTGLETPELIELRKKKIEEAMDGRVTPQLFTMVPEKPTATVGTAMMGSTHIYDMSAVMGRKGPGAEAWGVEVALAPEELELDPTAMTQKYEEHVREQQAQVEKEDFSDMVAEHAAKQKPKKRKAQPQDARGGGQEVQGVQVLGVTAVPSVSPHCHPPCTALCHPGLQTGCWGQCSTVALSCPCPRPCPR
ncbi:LOW QUALITY PROTEIN: hypothetical protein Nmel_005195 [Mimus melanotis]